eukprot:SAG11_NODE_2926_length_2833_cov_2.590344_2_plen_79_part_00
MVLLVGDERFMMTDFSIRSSYKTCIDMLYGDHVFFSSSKLVCNGKWRVCAHESVCVCVVAAIVVVICVGEWSGGGRGG